MQREGRQLVDLLLPESCRAGSYVDAGRFEIDRLDVLEREVFGPILHVVRYERGSLDKVVAAINATGYGLTLGLHSRIEAVADYVAEHARVGNIYVNRNQIGAVVGVQPFGGEGLSGTGPKAGGPNYAARLCHRARALDRRHVHRREPRTAHRGDDYRPLTRRGILQCAGADRHAVGEWLVYWARGMITRKPAGTTPAPANRRHTKPDAGDARRRACRRAKPRPMPTSPPSSPR